MRLTGDIGILLFIAIDAKTQDKVEGLMAISLVAILVFSVRYDVISRNYYILISLLCCKWIPI